MAFTPADYKARAAKARIGIDLVEQVEDVRINGRQTRETGIYSAPLECPNATQQKIARTLSMGNIEGTVANIIQASTHPTTQKEVLTWLYGSTEIPVEITNDLRTIQRVVEALYDGIYGASDKRETFSATLAAAKEIRSLTKRIEQTLEKLSQKAGEKEEISSAEEEIDSKWAQGVSPGVEYRKAGWKGMTLEPLRLTRPARNRPERKWTVRDEGCIPTAIHRYSVDGRIFRQPTHRDEGFAILIDGSGSMCWQPEQLKEVLDKAPATTVAIYSSSYKGVLRILSQGGRKVEDHLIEPPGGGDNGVDGPALAWLAVQKGKKIWLSDGGVTGAGGSTANLMQDCGKIMKAARILRIEEADEVVNIVKGKSPYKYQDPYQDPIIGHYMRWRT
jgi:hypothetical protein